MFPLSKCPREPGKVKARLVGDLRPLVTDEIALEDFEPAFAKLEAGEACKIVVYPGGRPSAPRVAETPTREPVEAITDADFLGPD